MASRLLSSLKERVKSLELIPSSGGCFELTVDGQLVYSKLQTGQFPDEGRVVAQLDQAAK